MEKGGSHETRAAREVMLSIGTIALGESGTPVRMGGREEEEGGEEKREEGGKEEESSTCHYWSSPSDILLDRSLSLSLSLSLSPPMMIVASSLSVLPALFSATQRNWDPFTPSNTPNSNTLTTFSATTVVILYTSSSVMLPPSLSSQTMVGRGTPVAVQLRLMKSQLVAVTLDGSSRNEGVTVKCGRRRVRRKRGVGEGTCIKFYHSH